MFRLNFVFMALIIGSIAHAQVYSPRAKEVKITVGPATFETEQGEEAEVLAEAHLSHLFGLLKSKKIVREYGVDPSEIEGLGAPQMPAKIDIKSVTTTSDGKQQITYKATTKALIVNEAADQMLQDQFIELPMPYQLDEFYDKDCTDHHYNTMGDFWYFFDPFESHCLKLTKEPLAKPVQIKIAPATRRELDMDPRLDLLRGANANGTRFQIDMIHGFSESSAEENDAGRLNFEEANTYFENEGFSKNVVKSTQQSELVEFTKKIRLDTGKVMDVVVRHLLVNSDSDARSNAFAKFFKDAVENADVLIYAGHSGLGANLDIELLEEKAGDFIFNSKKRQIFYFDSCSSYSYYLDQFRDNKTRSRLDIMTNALASYFHTGPAVLESFLNILLEPSTEPTTWDYIIESMESPLGNGSYLLNVGGI